jgi:hypothetical protein
VIIDFQRFIGSLEKVWKKESFQKQEKVMITNIFSDSLDLAALEKDYEEVQKESHHSDGENEF